MKTISQLPIIILFISILWFIPVSKVFSPENTSQMIECSVFTDDNGTLSLIDVADFLPNSVSAWFSLDQIQEFVIWNLAMAKFTSAGELLIVSLGVFVIVKVMDKKYAILFKNSNYVKFYNFSIRAIIAGFIFIIIISVIQITYLYYFTDLPSMLETLRIAKAKLVLKTPFYFVEI